MEYFDFYELPVTFLLDKKKLRRLFLLKSKAYHPDFYTLESEEKQAEILALSTLNNEAYKILSDDEKRLKYILTQKGMIGEGVKNTMPPAFLMETMEINEQIMEMQFDFDAKRYQELLRVVEAKEVALEARGEQILADYSEINDVEQKKLVEIRDYYLQKRYLLRLKENIAQLG